MSEKYQLLPIDYSRVMTDWHFNALVHNFKHPEGQGIVSARWFSISNDEYFGLEINPDRPSVVFGFAELPVWLGGGLEFSTFWYKPERGNPYSKGNSLYEQQLPIEFQGEEIKLNFWFIDDEWEPISLEQLKKERGW